MMQLKLMFFLIFWSESTKFIRSDCNVIDPKKPEKNEFIELKSTCSGKILLRGYKLIDKNSQSKTGTIDLVVTLWNERTTDDGFFTIGGPGVSTANLKIPHEMVEFRSSFTGKSSVMSNFLPNSEIRAIGLLHDPNTNNAFKDYVLTKKQQLVKITSDIVLQLKEYLIDLVDNSLMLRYRKSNQSNSIWQKRLHSFGYSLPSNLNFLNSLCAIKIKMGSCHSVNTTTNTEIRMNGPDKMTYKQTGGTKSRGGEFGDFKTQHTVTITLNQ